MGHRVFKINYSVFATAIVIVGLDCVLNDDRECCHGWFTVIGKDPTEDLPLAVQTHRSVL